MPYWLHILVIVLIVYVTISIALYYLQDYMLFKPEKLPKDFEFYYENQDIVENLKLRASFGKTGNQAIPVFSTFSTLIEAIGLQHM